MGPFGLFRRVCVMGGCVCFRGVFPGGSLTCGCHFRWFWCVQWVCVRGISQVVRVCLGGWVSVFCKCGLWSYGFVLVVLVCGCGCAQPFVCAIKVSTPWGCPNKPEKNIFRKQKKFCAARAPSKSKNFLRVFDRALKCAKSIKCPKKPPVWPGVAPDVSGGPADPLKGTFEGSFAVFYARAAGENFFEVP